ncbi:hypothetical protein Gbfr_005_056 [Gluconobacter frateurii M-2]|nr:hypothetical protein Gbfr_005_056 [Gluconobacter frateurii M-2]
MGGRFRCGGHKVSLCLQGWFSVETRIGAEPPHGRMNEKINKSKIFFESAFKSGLELKFYPRFRGEQSLKNLP